MAKMGDIDMHFNQAYFDTILKEPRSRRALRGKGETGFANRLRHGARGHRKLP